MRFRPLVIVLTASFAAVVRHLWVARRWLHGARASLGPKKRAITCRVMAL
jgi:hypothetical protein